MKQPIVRHKKQLNINISPYLMKEIVELVDEKNEFSGYSDLCTIAITQFLERYKTLKNAQTPLSTDRPDMPLSLMNLISGERASTYI